MSSLAESRAADVSAGRQRLDAGRDTLDRYRANELAEAEALSLARIKAETERALAHQAQTLRDTERAAELVAIERRSTDLEAIKEAQRRQVLEQEAQAAATARANADALAATVALEKKAVLAAAHDAHQARLCAQREALLAQRNSRRARIRLAWLALRTASPIAVGLVALLLGAGAGWLAAESQDNSEHYTTTNAAPLKLDTELLLPSSRR
jgi:hypothetical protein